jgi:NADH-quinone oxidoreductase subunit H
MNIIYSFGWFIFSFVVLSIVGLFVGWIDRKITARIQWRVGPPWYQNFADFIKLTGKEVLIPEGSNKFIFIFSPVLAVIASTICGSIILLVLKNSSGFIGSHIARDLVRMGYNVVIYDVVVNEKLIRDIMS